MSRAWPRNILYIMSDQQRFDSLSCVGRSICRTPHIDALAARGVNFTNAYSVCALCSPARASMLGGRFPHNHRMWNNNDMMQWATRELPDGERLISQDLTEAGFNCGYSGKWHCGHTKVPSSYGFVGMDVPDYGWAYNSPEYKEYLGQRGLEPPQRIHTIAPWGGGTLSGPPEACEPYFIADYALGLLERFNRDREETGKPFLLFVSFWAPHISCFIPEPYASMYDPAEVALWPGFKDDHRGKPKSQARYIRSFYPEAPKLSEEGWRQLIAKYWGFCSFVDDQVGRLVAALEMLGRAADTAVLFSTDHGDMQGNHGGFWDKGEFMYEDTYHIPLVVSAPGVGPEGATCDSLVWNMDLASTALDLAGLPVPATHDGRSLVPLLRNPRAEWRDDLVCEFHGHRYLYSQRMLRWKSWKYVYNPSDEDELYDLEADPDEMVNAIDLPKYAGVAEECRARLLAWIAETKDPLEHAAKMQLARTPPPLAKRS